jgi:hypothetical protein
MQIREWAYTNIAEVGSGAMEEQASPVDRPHLP